MEKTACGGGGDTSPFLPEDSLIHILVRLPVLSLLRFKSVCKSWLALIQTSFFIDLHTTFNSSSSKFDTFILRTNKYSSERKDEILMLSSEYGSEYEHESEYGSKYEHESEYGDWYRCTDGSWHKFTGGDGGGYWLWDNTNCGWYWVSGGGGVDWHWDDTNFGWYWVSDGRDWLWDDTNSSWYWVGDDDKNDQEVFKDDDQLLLKLTNLELPSCYNLTCYKFIAGSCNGLICLHDYKLRDVSLWNPATRQFRILPKSITIEIDDDFVQTGIDFIAFGFDVKTKDYKVLLITKFSSKTGPQWPPKFCRVQVYSLRTDSWRLFEGINSPLDVPADYCINCGLYLNGSCFFLANVYHTESNTTSRFIINSFDFTKEIFTTMQFPDHDYRQSLFLCCFGGDKMALFTTLAKTLSGEYAYTDERHYYYYEDCDIWVWNEHGGCGGMNIESWTKLHSFQIVHYDGRCLPKGISNNGKFVLLETNDSLNESGMQLYNLVTKEAIMDFPFSVSTMSEFYVYKLSLVSVLGGNGAAAASPAIG